ncbi:MAG: hypothetical protein R2851_09135 [Caldilineaceae bacterium]
MDNHVCPFLGTLDETYKRGPHVDYPSFENRCLAVDEYGEDEACVVMLSDQATFCLSSGHALCPRYQAAQEAAATKESRRRRAAKRPPPRAAPPASPPIGCNRAWMNWTRIWMTATTRRSTGVCGAGSARCSSFSRSSSAAAAWPSSWAGRP